jgi:hypothetical protein
VLSPISSIVHALFFLVFGLFLLFLIGLRGYNEETNLGEDKGGAWSCVMFYQITK